MAVSAENELITTKICMTKDVGVNDNLFGGNMMAYIDEAGATYACQVCSDTRLVTVKIDELVFKNPVKVGEHIKFYGSVIKIGETSITINIRANSHNVRNGTQRLVCETNIKFVRIDEFFGKPLCISKDVKDRFQEYLSVDKES